MSAATWACRSTTGRIPAPPCRCWARCGRAGPGRRSSSLQEINRTQAIIRHLTGRTPTLFRPPYGQASPQVRDRAARLGLTEVLWTVDTRDWAGASTAEIVAAAATVQPGGIILMHDNGFEETVLAVPEILSTLSRRGLRPGRIVQATFGGTVAVAP